MIFSCIIETGDFI